MANRKISELPASGALTGAELVELVQGGINKQTTTQDIADLGGGGVTSVNGETGVVVLDASDVGVTPAGGISATDVQTAINELDTEKQATLVSGTSIKTVNGASILGSGDIVVASTREFNRTFSETINFDQNIITYEIHTMTDDIMFIVGDDNLVDQESNVVIELIADGVHTIDFGPAFAYLYNVQRGQVLAAGTYEIYIWYLNGRARVNIPGSTLEGSVIVQLSAPANFAAVADGENDMDLSWDDVANNSSYQIEYSADGLTGWTLLSNPTADATTATDTGLASEETVFYRIKAVGDGVNFSDSPYSTTSGTTEGTGAEPNFTFAPVNGSSTLQVNSPVVITSDTPIRNADGSEITNANAAAVVTLKQTNSGGTNIAFTATIDVSKTIITVTPTTLYGGSQLVYVAIHDVEDIAGSNAIAAPVSITFTTTDYSFFNGTSSRLTFSDAITAIDTILTANDAVFSFEITYDNLNFAGTHTIIGKYNDAINQKCLRFWHSGTDVYFAWYNLTGGFQRRIKWTNVLTSGSHKLDLLYNGAVDTNDGLDRLTLEIDDVVAGSKTLDNSSGTWLTQIDRLVDSQANLTVAALSSGEQGGTMHFLGSGDLKGFVFRAGATIEINVPILRSGLDTSGNARHATWLE
jgi:hypothetical protein